jgi:hypothetical protein
MPDKGQYKLIFDGKLLEGHNLDDVKKRLGRLQKSDSNKINQLLAEAPLTIKSNLDYPSASKYRIIHFQHRCRSHCRFKSQ